MGEVNEEKWLLRPHKSFVFLDTNISYTDIIYEVLR